MIAPGTIGMTAPRTAKPRPCSASQACTPPPASSPNAEPPESAMASIALHGVGEVEQRALAGAGTAAAHVDRRHRRAVEHDRGDAGGQRCVIGVADADAGDIGEEIFHRTFPAGGEMTAGPRRGQPAGAAAGRLSRAILIILARSDLR